MKKRLLPALLASFAFAAPAGEITADQAAVAVGNWLRLGRDPTERLGGEVAGVATVADEETGAAVHVVRLSGGGSVVTSADDGVDPVLAFSESAVLSVEEGSPLRELLRVRAMPPARRPASSSARTSAPVRGTAGTDRAAARGTDGGGADGALSGPAARWAELLGEETSSASGRRAAAQTATGTAISEIRVAPLLSTRWSQTTHDNTDDGFPCYNYYTPARTDGSEDNMPCGCVATAGAQLMKYWKHPAQAAAASVACSVDGTETTLAMFGGAYDWAAMPDDPSPGCGETARKAIGKITHDVGVAIGSDYGNWETAGSIFALAKALKNRFGYEAPESVSWDSFDPEAFRAVLVPNLDAGAPVVISVASLWSGHAAVADGYGFSGSSLCVHLNMGWAGLDDLWYVPPDIASSDGGYDAIDGAVFNVFPARAGSLATVRVVGPAGRPAAGATCTVAPTGTLSVAKSDPAAGLFVFSGPPGTYTFTATAGGKTGSATATTRPIDSDDGTGNVEVTVKLAGLASAGTVSVSQALADKSLGGSCSVSSGTATCTAPVLVTLKASVSGAQVRYTLDGTEPGPASALYAGPFRVDDSCTLRARAFKSGAEAGASAVAKYVFKYGTNDAFAKARPLAGASGSATFDNEGCTKETGEPEHSPRYSDGASVWAVWKAPAAGTYTFELTGTREGGWDTLVMLAAYTGTKVSALKAVEQGENPSDGPARIAFKAAAGTVYRIAMASADGVPVRFDLRWTAGTFDYVEPEKTTVFVPAQGGKVSVPLVSSGNWTAPERSSWITGAASGEKGGPLVFSVAANGTGKARTGVVVLRAGNVVSSVTVLQSSLPFETTRAAALKAAKAARKPVLLVYGRESCGNTRATLFGSAEDPSVKTFLQQNYVVWFCDCDTRGSESGTLLNGIRGYVLPFLAVFDPFDPSKAVRDRYAYADAAALLAFLKPRPAVTPRYTVVYKANGGKGTMPSQLAAVGKKTALKKNKFKRSGWVFIGWATSKTGAPVYKDGYAGTGLKTAAGKAPAAGQTVKLYARWAKAKYKVAFQANGGKGKMAAQTFKYGKAAKLSANKFKRKGYVFKGWAKSKALAKKGKVAYKNKKKVKNLVTTGKTVKLYAVWKPAP